MHLASHRPCSVMASGATEAPGPRLGAGSAARAWLQASGGSGPEGLAQGEPESALLGGVSPDAGGGPRPGSVPATACVQAWSL